MILHHFYRRSWKIKLFWAKTQIFYQKSRKYPKNPEKYKKIHGFLGTHVEDPCEGPMWRTHVLLLNLVGIEASLPAPTHPSNWEWLSWAMASTIITFMYKSILTWLGMRHRTDCHSRQNVGTQHGSRPGFTRSSYRRVNIFLNLFG